jgi:cell division protein FtsB
LTLFFAALWARLSGYVAAAGVFLGIVVAAFLYGRSDGRQDAAAAQNKANAAARKQSKEVENEINGLDDPVVDQRLSEWLRDGKR